MQELSDTTRGLVADWTNHAFAVTPASLPPALHRRARARSKTYAAVPDANFANTFWLRVCRIGVTLMPINSCLFMPIRHPTPYPDFAGVVVIVTGYADGVRQGARHAIQAMGGECASAICHARPTLPALARILPRRTGHAPSRRVRSRLDTCAAWILVSRVCACLVSVLLCAYTGAVACFGAHGSVEPALSLPLSPPPHVSAFSIRP